MELTVDTMQTGAATRIRLGGEMDLATSGLVHDAVIAALASEAVRDVILDVADLTFIDSTGMGTLVACQRAVAVRGGALRLENLAPVVRRQLFAAGLLGLLGAGTEDQAAPSN
ncbi:STAS domain-containing protein [Micromonospora saelicesensis]|uniref:Anti-sigma factor antagonist n=1 Tax=Micromonospora saelicesensis TaxID=285676 RepID=A0A1C4Z4Y2_9ACTN|nr:STAS domain-containing protein [Micromonospora saelicesensis]SCF28079.1 anti-anti-sigma regulatory factor, SpoIIAA [Micromonospora saelicesensis]